MRTKARNTDIKERLVIAAWELFTEKGYEETTITDIIERSKTSRGSFYHHFRAKEDLIFSLAYFFDENYDEWMQTLPPALSAVEKLTAFNQYIFKNIESSRYAPFLSTLYGLQVMTGGTRHILNPRRRYYQILNQFTKEGIDSGEISFPGSYKELSEQIASLQRGLTYDWCLNEQRYSLLHRGNQIVSGYLYSLKSPDSGQHSRSV